MRTKVDKKLSERRAYVYKCRVAAIREWLEKVFVKIKPEVIVPSVEELESRVLWNGILLADLAAAFSAVPHPPVIRESKLKYKFTENINTFQELADELGLPDICLFEQIDLYEWKNPPKVFLTIHAVSWALYFRGLVDSAIPDLVDKIVFEPEHLESTRKFLDESGLNIPEFADVKDYVGSKKPTLNVVEEGLNPHPPALIAQEISGADMHDDLGHTTGNDADSVAGAYGLGNELCGGFADSLPALDSSPTSDDESRDQESQNSDNEDIEDRTLQFAKHDEHEPIALHVEPPCIPKPASSPELSELFQSSMNLGEFPAPPDEPSTAVEALSLPSVVERSPTQIPEPQIAQYDDNDVSLSDTPSDYEDYEEESEESFDESQVVEKKRSPEAFQRFEQQVIKVQSLVRARQQGQAYKVFTSSKDPPISVIKHFAHLINDNDMGYEEEAEIEILRQKITTRTIEHRELVRCIGELDAKIGLLAHNKIAKGESHKMDLGPTLPESIPPPPEDPSVMWIETKRCLLWVLRVQSGTPLLRLLMAVPDDEDEARWEALLGEGLSCATLQELSSMSFRELKAVTLENILALEDRGLVTRDNDFQDLLNDIALDIRFKNQRRARGMPELARLRKKLKELDEENRGLNDRLQTYNDTFEQNLNVLQKRKRKIRLLMPFSTQWNHQREIARGGREPSYGSYKYTAESLADKGILLEWRGVGSARGASSGLYVTISSNEVGRFDIEGHAGNVAIPGASATFTWDDLIDAQYRSEGRIVFFGGEGPGELVLDLQAFLKQLGKKFWPD